MKNTLFDLYSDYLISSFALVTATGLSLLLDNEYSHDQFTRFLSGAEHTSRNLWALEETLLPTATGEQANIQPGKFTENFPQSSLSENAASALKSRQSVFGIDARPARSSRP